MYNMYKMSGPGAHCANLTAVPLGPLSAGAVLQERSLGREQAARRLSTNDEKLVKCQTVDSGASRSRIVSSSKSVCQIWAAACFFSGHET